ncbi:hypothetical protein [Pleionea sp. CnH1-48]|uniref:hypothetical protein n=1 Tax=Pleionea sp. CnH1-48 TaxID=2954494 RepID=UPI002097515F|nr:hypothetical protein [Pleionea sp. CnH1-48]MCO7223271.1 hypothetical protein [Pleionea sp. CnH1-48]
MPDLTMPVQGDITRGLFDIINQFDKVSDSAEIRCKDGSTLYAKEQTTGFNLFGSRTSHRNGGLALVTQLLEKRLGTDGAKAALADVMKERTTLTLGDVKQLAKTHNPDLQALIGKTVDPATAQSLENVVLFDGFGRVVEFLDEQAIENDASILERLTQGITAGLIETNSRSERNTYKTEGECVIAMISQLKQEDSAIADQCISTLKATWLSGEMSQQRVHEVFTSIANQDGLSEVSQDLASELLTHIEQEKPLTQYQDGLYSRKFESELVRELVQNTPDTVRNASAKMGQYIVDQLVNAATTDGVLNEGELNSALRELACVIEGDTRPWFEETPDIKSFIDEPTLENFTQMMTQVNNGFDTIKVPFVSVKLATTSNDIMKQSCSHWKAPATILYGQVKSARSTDDQISSISQPKKQGSEESVTIHTKVQSTKTQDYGTRLNYQPRNDEFGFSTYGKSFADAKIPNSQGSGVSAFEERALTNNSVVVSGTSGSTNLLTFLGREMEKTVDGFSVDDMYLPAMMFLTFDGGHSINESWSVFNAMKIQRPIEEIGQTLNHTVLDYRALMDLLPQDDQGNFATAIDNAIERVVEMRESIH